MPDTEQQKKRLLVSNGIRILLALCILALKIPDFVKIFLLMMTDAVDCGIPDFLIKDWIDCKGSSLFYQKMDKLTDTVTYTFLLFYILKTTYVSAQMKGLLVSLFALRSLGTSLFLRTEDRKYLFYFPNFFLELCLGLSVLQYYPSLRYYTLPILLGIVLYKYIQEYYLHIYLPSKNAIKNK